jgi:benzoate membrane transport protein
VPASRPAAPAASEPDDPPPGLREILHDLGGAGLASAVAAFLFAASGPVAIILTVGTRGGLGPGDLSSWLFGAFTLNGLISLAFCWRYRQPLVFFWTIPGTVLIGPTLAQLGLPAVLGACLAAGLVVLLLGATGWVRRAMEAVPLPIVMGMVAGVFLRFGLELVYAVRDDGWIAGPMVVVFAALSLRPGLARRAPPLIGALLVGALATVVLGRLGPGDLGADPLVLARPRLYLPALSVPALIELVVPLAITVLVVQNGQGIAVLRQAGHRPPVTELTVACGLGAVVTALVGAAPTCLTGPVNAIVSAAGDRRRHYAAAMAVAVLGLGFGLLSPLVTRLMLAAPPAFVAALAGLAMLRVLQTAFGAAFRDRCSLGALVGFLVTVADVPIWRVGAPFWGLVLGLVASWLLERDELRAAAR